MTPVRISYQLNILRMNEVNLIKFCIFIDIDKHYWVGIVMHQFVQIYKKKLWSLNHVRILFILLITRMNDETWQYLL